MTAEEKKLLAAAFHKAAEAAEKTIEAELDAWIAGNKPAELDKALLNIAELAIRMLRERP
jgi:hypothetical protein